MRVTQYLVIILSANSSFSLFADVPLEHIELKTKPDRCIALRQGQKCFQKVQFTWSTPPSNDYCLYEQEETQALACWHGNELSRLSFRFESVSDREFYIFNETQKTKKAHTRIRVGWVYKSSKKISTGWRLF